eukprot:11163-Eustigmatos_ZCMA.PRE.1
MIGLIGCDDHMDITQNGMTCRISSRSLVVDGLKKVRRNCKYSAWARSVCFGCVTCLSSVDTGLITQSGRGGRRPSGTISL